MIWLINFGYVSINPPASTPMRRPIGISTFIGIQGSILNIVGLFFPWTYSLADRYYWTMGTQLPIVWSTFFISLLAIISFIFRTRDGYWWGFILGVFALIISGPFFFIIQLDSLVIVGGLCLSFAGSMLIAIGGIIGLLQTPKKRIINQNNHI
jgi:hypothetical protein